MTLTLAGLPRSVARCPMRESVLLNTPPKDTHGRSLATLFVDDKDVALSLIKRGLVVVYTPYPFPALPLYLSAQDRARAERRGLWGNEAASARAAAVAKAWENEGAP